MDAFFQNAYGGGRNLGNEASLMDSVLGNIGAPLRVSGEIKEGENYLAEWASGVQGIELDDIHTQRTNEVV